MPFCHRRPRGAPHEIDEIERVGRLPRRRARRRRARRHAGPGAPARACGDRASMRHAISRRERQAEGRAAQPPPQCRQHAQWGRGAVASNPASSRRRVSAALRPRRAHRTGGRLLPVVSDDRRLIVEVAEVEGAAALLLHVERGGQSSGSGQTPIQSGYKQRGNVTDCPLVLPPHNRSAAGPRPPSSATQSCAIRLSWCGSGVYEHGPPAACRLLGGFSG
jgi:hypothetical protein